MSSPMTSSHHPVSAASASVIQVSNPTEPAESALTCLTEVELAMIGGRMARAFMVDDAPSFEDLLSAIDIATAPSEHWIAGA